MTDRAQQPTEEETPVCALSPADLARRRQAIDRDLFRHVEEVRELADGFAYRFPSLDPFPEAASAFVAAERRCCPFFTFELVFEPHDGPLWLRLRGSASHKRFLRDQLAASPLPHTPRP